MERQLSLEDLVDFLPELGPLVADDSVTEIMVNGPGSLYAERSAASWRASRGSRRR